ncbi:sigma-70 family RNA polymerase sigma factor [Lysinibacillus yapensis]|uniref:Sigma-70 family RNA polymerase sigma factor n=1 Tax=Ureibacillus yapensis TaxID=2304605 RepID=A0A396SKR0_9BACL|nr:sigma-70 family RNA polymerase sigma factor [Lysinibacillus yapensis]RHW35788.1 sigma-70 family RNA polymerase sigma factor [Lysinibacillus yapensis]
MNMDEKILNSKKFEKFLEGEKNKLLYLNYRLMPNEENAMKLDEAYKKFERQLIARSYLRKVIAFEARKFDAKIRAKEKKNISLHATIEDGSTLEGVLVDEKSCHIYERVLDSNLEEIFEDRKLSKAVAKLTIKQKNILSQIYLWELSEKEIANNLKLTQQAVSKVHRTALKRLREVMKR